MSILAALPAPVNFGFATGSDAPEADEPRPTADFSYYPDLEEERDARELFDADEADEPTDAEWDAGPRKPWPWTRPARATPGSEPDRGGRHRADPSHLHRETEGSDTPTTPPNKAATRIDGPGAVELAADPHGRH